MKENFNEVMKKLCGDNEKAIDVVKEMAKNGKKLPLLIALYERNITGNNIVILYEKNFNENNIKTLYDVCCKGDSQIFKITIKLFEDGVFSSEEIINNLSSPNPSSFIDDIFTGELLSSLDNEEYFASIWEKFKLCNREIFNKKIKESTPDEIYKQVI